MAVAVARKTLDGVEVPAAGTWTIDPSHSTVGFAVRHLVVAKVRGRFGEFSGTIHVARNLEESWAEATIVATSIDTREDKRDAHLRSPDFLDAASYPTLTFRSDAPARQTGRTTFDLPGALTIRGVTRPVVLSVEYGGVASDPWGGSRAAFTATTTIDREDFGLTWNQVLEAGGVVVGKQISIELDVEAVYQPSLVQD